MAYRISSGIVTDDFASANNPGTVYCARIFSTTYDVFKSLAPLATPFFSESTSDLLGDLIAGHCDIAIGDRATLAQELLLLEPADASLLRLSSKMYSREPVFGAVKRGGKFPKIVKNVSSGLQLANVLGVTQSLAKDNTYDFKRLNNEGFMLVTENFDACATCGTMRDAISAVGNYYEMYAKYVEAYLSVRGSLNDVYTRGGGRVPLFWMPDVHVGAAVVAEPAPLVDRLRMIRQRGKVNCGFDVARIPGYAGHSPYLAPGDDGYELIEGIEVDMCVALAVAALGGSKEYATQTEAFAANRKLINVVLVSDKEKFEVVRNGTVDVMMGVRCTIAADMTQKVSTSSPYQLSAYSALVKDVTRANPDAHLLESVRFANALVQCYCVCLLSLLFLTYSQDAPLLIRNVAYSLLSQQRYCAAAHVFSDAARTFPIATPRPIIVDDYRNLNEILEANNCDVYIDLLHIVFTVQMNATSPLAAWKQSPKFFGLLCVGIFIVFMLLLNSHKPLLLTIVELCNCKHCRPRRILHGVRARRLALVSTATLGV
jgi:ABC-type amino acid transport substrate-binding protein